ncbi:MAG: hypothetical protein KF850_15235 [Labilithrix sp.]|nr:hypothetical protein [Labilithrix sp.]MBX3213389.1 hypothetical protein [Labilithrix sp.]
MRVRTLLLGLIVALTLALGAGCSREERETIPNVRLGMAPRDVRGRFQPGADGSWQTALGTGDDTVLEWTSRDGRGSVTHARFEFHLGMLVAIRARLNESVSREEVSTTPKTVTVRAPAREGGATLTVLARDCPTHKDEAESLAAKSR